jgi:phage gp16-like protein
MNSATTIPGTTTPYPVYERKGPPPLKTDAHVKQRRGLLAKIHIAKQQMGLNSGEYEMILKAFKVSTAADLTLPQLENMVKLLKHYGWKPRKSRKAAAHDDRLDALRRRCVEAAKALDNGEKRLAGLALKICGVSQLTWCRDAAKLERLLAVLGKIKS